MSLTVDGVWKAGVWAASVWAAGVWFEGRRAGKGRAGRRPTLRYSVEIDGYRRVFGTEEEALRFLARRAETLKRRVLAQADAREKRLAKARIAEEAPPSERREYVFVPEPELPKLVVRGGAALQAMAAEITKRLAAIMAAEEELRELIAQEDEELLEWI